MARNPRPRRTTPEPHTEAAQDSPDRAEAAHEAPAPARAGAPAAEASPPASAAPFPAACGAALVVGPPGGRRRAGRQFGREPVTIPFDALTEADLDALRADPLLGVSILPGPPDPAPGD